MYGRNIYEKRILTTLVVAGFLIGAPTVYWGFQALDHTQINSLNGNIGLGGTVGQVYAYNGSVYELQTISGAGTIATNSISFTMAANFTGTHIVIFLKNSNYDVKGMLNRSNLFNTMNVATTLTGYTGNFNITSAYFLIGSQYNSTSMKSIGDKAVKNPTLNETVYSSTVNNLNKTKELSFNDAGRSDLTATPAIVLNFNSTLKASSGTNTIKVTVTQYLQQPNNFNLLYIQGAIYVGLGIIAVVGVVAGLPKIGGRP